MVKVKDVDCKDYLVNFAMQFPGNTHSSLVLKSYFLLHSIKTSDYSKNNLYVQNACKKCLIPYSDGNFFMRITSKKRKSQILNKVIKKRKQKKNLIITCLLCKNKIKTRLRYQKSKENIKKGKNTTVKTNQMPTKKPQKKQSKQPPLSNKNKSKKNKQKPVNTETKGRNQMKNNMLQLAQMLKQNSTLKANNQLKSFLK